MPRVSAELPESGERFEGLVPPVVAAPCFAIRRPAIAVFSLDDYVEAGIMSCAQANLLRRAVQDRRNILVAGGTSTGKTTLINALLAEVAFLNGNVDRRTVSGERIDAPVSPYVLQAGAVIPAALLTGLRSDLPGQVTAQVTEDVYDSPTGSTRLIPQGARLVGQYDAQIAFGQTRALLVWTRLIMPNGRSIVLERQPGADAEGYAGLEDEVDNHWGTLFKAAILATLLSIGSEVGSSGSEDDLIRAIRRGGSDSVNQIGQRIVGRSLNVQPTITIRPGFPVRVLVTRDLVLEPYRE
ncbi:ATPase, T2SS/T4P/T4SS family [Reyranella sp.]|uniref:ATPase, T2SS/T4P/T4SS family n=1 Tax=Reyranella sp. TaxID=1929291 RepID=UPI003783F0F7